MNLNHTLLTGEQEQALIALAKQGDHSAQETLLEHNEKLIYKIASRFLRTSAPDIEIDDLMQEGRRGLLHAALKWDNAIAKKRSVKKFSTYASWWVYQYIRRAACKHRSGFSRSVELDDMSYSIQRIRGELLKKLKREPKPKEIARSSKIPIEKVKIILNSPHIVRLDDMDTNGDKPIYDSISDPSANVEEISETTLTILEYMTFLEREFPRHARIVKMLFGLNSKSRLYSLEEVAKLEKITRQRVQQIKEDALTKMRSLNNQD